MTPVRLLVVDDDAGMRNVMVRMGQWAGYIVHGLPSAAEALAWLEQWQADLVVADATLTPQLAVVTDIVMPDMDGCTLGREIIKRWPGTRLLFISGYVHDDLLAKRICPGTIPLLPKPFSRDAFADRIAEVLASPPWDGT
jgi:CheY-like chemotaxis protein